MNLFLEVIGKRGDGYHELRSVIVPIGLCDTVRLARTDGLIETEVNNGKLSGGNELCLAGQEENLATRAAVSLKERTGYKGGALIVLQKELPVGGGLGGGSADAAAVLVGLNELWQTGVSRAELGEIGFGLGCDIPALLHGGAVCMTGLGEEIVPIAVSDDEQSQWWLVVVNPGFSISTADIYSRCSSPLTSREFSCSNVVSALETGDVGLAAKSLFNGLQELVFTKYPIIRMAAEGLESAGALGVLLSGSGASLFGLARDEEHARGVVAKLSRELGFAVWSEVTRILPDGVMVAHGPLEA